METFVIRLRYYDMAASCVDKNHKDRKMPWPNIIFCYCTIAHRPLPQKNISVINTQINKHPHSTRREYIVFVNALWKSIECPVPIQLHCLLLYLGKRYHGSCTYIYRCSQRKCSITCTNENSIIENFHNNRCCIKKICTHLDFLGL